MKLREVEALPPEIGCRPEEANNKHKEARRGEQRAGNVEKEWDLPDNANGYTHAGWVSRLLDQMLFEPFCRCLPISNQSDQQCPSGKAPISVPSKDAVQNPALPESSWMSKLMLWLVRSVQRGPPIKPGPQPHPH